MPRSKQKRMPLNSLGIRPQHELVPNKNKQTHTHTQRHRGFNSAQLKCFCEAPRSFCRHLLLITRVSDCSMCLECLESWPEMQNCLQTGQSGRRDSLRPYCAMLTAPKGCGETGGLFSGKGTWSEHLVRLRFSTWFV